MDNRPDPMNQPDALSARTVVNPKSSNSLAILLPALKRYEQALNELASPQPSEQQVMELLLARDAVQSAVTHTPEPTAEAIARLARLDQQFRNLGPTIAAAAPLQEWQASIRPAADSWWWHIEPPTTVHSQGRWDWFWNALTAGCLVYTAGCATAILQPFVIGGLTVAEATAMIAEGAGLVFVAKGTFTGTGKSAVKRLLSKFNISPRWHGEATFGLSLVLLGLTAGLHASLPNVGKLYLQQGLEYRSRGLLGEARRKYDKALELNPQKAETHQALGELDEALGQFGAAEAHYKQAIAEGQTAGLEQLGRVHLAKNEPVQAETVLELALRQVKDPVGQYPLHRHLGRAFLAQEKLVQAQKALQQAIVLERRRTDNPPGAGMAHCYLSQVFKQQNKEALSQSQLTRCQQLARPETLDEYQWLIRAGLHEVARTADTSAMTTVPD